MVKKIGILVLALVLSFALVLGGWGCAKPAPVEAVKWKLQSSFPLTSYAASDFAQPFIDMVKERSKGQLEIEMMPPGAMVKATESFTACSKGVIQAALSVGAYHSRVFPEAEVEQGLPCNFDTYDQSREFHYDYKDRAYLKLIDEAYRENGAHHLAVAGYTNSFQTKFPINTIDDLKGKKIRAVGATGKLIPALGGSTVTVAGAEQYTALQRGTADGTVMATYATRTYKLMEVTDYISLPSVNIGMLDIYCNLDAFNALPKDVQKIVEEAAVEAAQGYYKKYAELEAADVELAKKSGVQVLILPDAEFAKLREKAMPIWDEVAAKSPRCAAMIDILKEYLKGK